MHRYIHLSSLRIALMATPIAAAVSMGLGLAACGDEGPSTQIRDTVELGLDLDGDGRLDCVDRDGDLACTTADLPPPRRRHSCNVDIVTMDMDGNGCPDSADLTCDGVPDIHVVVMVACAGTRPADVMIAIDADGDGILEGGGAPGGVPTPGGDGASACAPVTLDTNGDGTIDCVDVDCDGTADRCRAMP